MKSRLIILTFSIFLISLIHPSFAVPTNYAYYNFSDSTNNKGYEDPADNSNLQPTPHATALAATTGVSSSCYTNLTTSDDVRCRVISTAAGREPFLRFDFTINEATSLIDYVYVTMEQQSTNNAQAGEDCAFGILNWTSQASETFGADTIAEATRTINYTGSAINNVINATTKNITLTASGFALDATESCDVDFVQVEVAWHPISLKANGTFTDQPTSIKTGETTIFTGNCTVSGGSANDVNVTIQDNRTGSFTVSSTAITSAVFVNVTNYTTPGSLSGNTANFQFLVNATTPGTYQFRTECESTSVTSPEVAYSNDVPSILTVTQSYGTLNVSINDPLGGSSTNKNQNVTFLVNASVSCIGITTAICDVVDAAARRNSTSGGQPDTNVPAGSGTPFHHTVGAESQTCGRLNWTSPSCNIQWTTNASGIIGTQWLLDVNFTSNNTNIISNDTANFQINITAPAGVDVGFTLAIPGNNATVFIASGQTATTIIFNSTQTTILQLNGTAAGGAQQNETIPIFNFTNTGNVVVNITANFTDSPNTIPAGITVKIGWAAAAYQQSCSASNAGPPSTTTCSNLTDVKPYLQVTFANMSTSGAGKYRDVWMWADYNNVVAGIDNTTNLLFNSTPG